MPRPVMSKTTGRSCYGHLGGKLGQLLFERMLEQGWLVLAEGRNTVYELTSAGYQEFKLLGIDLEE